MPVQPGDLELVLKGTTYFAAPGQVVPDAIEVDEHFEIACAEHRKGKKPKGWQPDCTSCVLLLEQTLKHAKARDLI